MENYTSFAIRLTALYELPVNFVSVLYGKNKNIWVEFFQFKMLYIPQELISRINIKRISNYNLTSLKYGKIFDQK